MNLFSGYPPFIFVLRFLQFLCALIAITSLGAAGVLVYSGVSFDVFDAMRTFAVGAGSLGAIEALLRKKPELFFGKDWETH